MGKVIFIAKSTGLGVPVYLVDSTFDILNVLMLTRPILSFVIVVFVFCAYIKFFTELGNVLA